MAGTQTFVSGALIVIIPWDRGSTRAAACRPVLIALERDVQLVFGSPGEGTIKVSGRRVTEDPTDPGEPITFEKQVIVR